MYLVTDADNDLQAGGEYPVLFYDGPEPEAAQVTDLLTMDGDPVTFITTSNGDDGAAKGQIPRCKVRTRCGSCGARSTIRRMSPVGRNQSAHVMIRSRGPDRRMIPELGRYGRRPLAERHEPACADLAVALLMVTGQRHVAPSAPPVTYGHRWPFRLSR
ncbi:hypothetical protein [Actinoplanes xinjiangensis]|uniref:hypothetical protein n=1 Tax=Actinoplanes xinjiangensis TaxID=512350 RepID=UPI0034129CA5